MEPVPWTVFTRAIDDPMRRRAQEKRGVPFTASVYNAKTKTVRHFANRSSALKYLGRQVFGSMKATLARGEIHHFADGSAIWNKRDDIPQEFADKETV